MAEEHRPAAGAALAALVAANAQALTSLNLSNCGLGDEGLRPLVGALAGNTALRSLDIRANDVTRALAVPLLAAVRANTSLRSLAAGAVFGGLADGGAGGVAHLRPSLPRAVTRSCA